MARILVLDDDRSILTLCRASLEASGHRVETFDDAETALEAIWWDGPFDALVLDLMMPGTSGTDVLAKLREHGLEKHLPVMVLSAKSDSEDRIRSLRNGAADYLTKPFHPEELLLRVEQLVRRSTPSVDELVGNLQIYSLADLLQSFGNSQQSGTLELKGRSHEGRIDLERGIVSEARFGRLRGEEALVALLGLDSGQFRFELGGGGATTTPLAQLPHLVLTAAYLADEVTRTEAWRPDDDVGLVAAEESHSENDLEPWELLHLERIQALPGITLGELVAHQIASPNRTLAIVSDFVGRGLVEERLR